VAGVKQHLHSSAAADMTAIVCLLLLLLLLQFDFEEDARKVSCACGAKNCRGFMN
jgi:hypothetical protein